MTDFKPGDRFTRKAPSGDKVYTRGEDGTWRLPEAKWGYDDTAIERAMTRGDNWELATADDQAPEPQEPAPAPPNDPEPAPVDLLPEEGYRVGDLEPPQTNPGPQDSEDSHNWKDWFR